MASFLGPGRDSGHLIPVGQILLQRGLITQAQLDDALISQKAWGSRIGQVLLGNGIVTAQQLYSGLAEHYNLPFVDLLKAPPDAALLEADQRQDYLDLGLLPWQRRGDGRTVIATTNIDASVVDWAVRKFGEERFEFVITSSFDISWLVQQRFSVEDDQDARERLWEMSPQDSARLTATRRQKLALAIMAGITVSGLILAPLPTLIILGFFINAFYLATFGLKLILTWVGADRRVDIQVTDEEVRNLRDADLPIYTLLIPLFHEAEVLPGLVDGLRRLDYPKSKLDIKLILEDDDSETIAAAKALACESIFEIIRVPPSQPKTKPKACNYALRFARGRYVTIFDAEDRPETDQLKKVVAAFRKATSDTACLQARLNYYNMDENFLTRSFTLEYSQWFDFLLPGLDALRIPIPLGGTSNHLDIKVLRSLGAWDPYNVTEDADLGVRLAKDGYRVGVVNSTTFEEANSHLGNWLRQRSRWLKGYMQTYLVHMRRPLELYRSLGFIGFWGFQFFIGGPPFVAAINPLMWAIFVLWLFGASGTIDSLFPAAVLYIALTNLLLGNLMYIYFGIVALFKRHYEHLILYTMLQPVYWALHSAAVYKGLLQLLVNPHFWEKTVHGLSILTRGSTNHHQPADISTGTLRTATTAVTDHARRLHPRGEWFSVGIFIVCILGFAAMVVPTVHTPLFAAALDDLLVRVNSGVPLAANPLFQTIGGLLPLALIKTLISPYHAGPLVLGGITAAIIAAVLAFTVRTAARFSMPRWEIALLLLFTAAHPLVLFSATAGDWMLVTAAAFFMVTLLIHRIELIGDVQSKMTLGLVLGLLMLSDPNALYVTLPLIAFLPWVDRGTHTPAETVAGWVLMLMPGIIIAASFLLGIKILFGTPAAEIVGRWIAPLHSIPWLYSPLAIPASGRATAAVFSPAMAIALGIAATPLIIVPLVCAFKRGRTTSAPRTALLSVVVPLVAGGLCIHFQHLGSHWSILAMLLFGTLAWLSKAQLPGSLRLTAIGLVGASTVIAWSSPGLWQNPALAAWRSALW